MIREFHKITTQEINAILTYVNKTMTMPEKGVITKAKRVDYVTVIAEDGMPAINFGTSVDKYSKTVENINQCIDDFRAGWAACMAK